MTKTKLFFTTTIVLGALAIAAFAIYQYFIGNYHYATAQEMENHGGVSTQIISHYKNSILAYDKILLKNKSALSRISLGLYQFKTGNNLPAKENILAGLAISEDQLPTTPKVYAYTILAQAAPNLKERKEYAEHALELATKANIPVAIFQAKLTLARTYQQQGLFEYAEPNYLEAISIIEQYPDIIDENNKVKPYGFLGNLYAEAKQKEKALNFYDKAYELTINMPNSLNKANYTASLGNGYMRIEQYNHACTAWTKAKEIYSSLGKETTQTNQDITEKMSEYCWKKGK